MIKISALQLNSSACLQENLDKVDTYLEQAAALNTRLLVLPEMFCLFNANLKTLLAHAEKYGQGPIQTFLSQQAKKNKLWLVAGTLPIQTDHDRVLATCAVFSPTGEQVAHYNKLHLFDASFSHTQETYQESGYTAPGNHVAMLKTPFANIGLTVCYDLRFPELYRALLNLGANIITVPSAFSYTTGKAEHWEVLLRARAIENTCYIIAPNQVGTHGNQRRTYGHSMIISPWGEKLAELTEEEGLIHAEYDPERLALVRRDLPSHKHQRLAPVHSQTLSKIFSPALQGSEESKQH
jgi:predicted amidohydrolase